jgi:hypothetical protein
MMRKKRTITEKDVGKVFRLYTKQGVFQEYQLVCSMDCDSYDYYYFIEDRVWYPNKSQQFLDEDYVEELNKLEILVLFGTHLPNLQKNYWTEIRKGVIFDIGIC